MHVCINKYVYLYTLPIYIHVYVYINKYIYIHKYIYLCIFIYRSDQLGKTSGKI
jgi:hypothetical protein